MFYGRHIHGILNILKALVRMCSLISDFGYLGFDFPVGQVLAGLFVAQVVNIYTEELRPVVQPELEDTIYL